MPRTKARQQIIHTPSTQEILTCLKGMTDYSQILLDNSPDIGFRDFLRWLLDVSYYREDEERTTIKKLATTFKAESSKVTKWINEIYEGIFNLNAERPELFQQQGIKVYFFIKSYDNYCSFFTTLNVLPRLFETVRFPFVHAKVGTDFFWVRKVEHEIDENTASTTLWLESGFVNLYREFLVDKALFYGEIGIMDEHQKHPFEIDQMLKLIYRR